MFSGFWTENKSVLFFMFINTLGMQYNITCKKPVTPPEAAVHNPKVSETKNNVLNFFETKTIMNIYSYFIRTSLES